jgi:hypothetical protein
VFSASCFAQTPVFQNFLSKNSPVGLVVFSSGQQEDDKDMLQRKFIADTSENAVTSFFKDKIKFMPMNKDINQDDYFKKDTIDGFFFDEIALTGIAKKKNCSSVLIIYYSYMPDPNGYVTKEGLKIHRLCSISSYLFDVKSVKLIHQIKSIESFSEKIDKKSDDEITKMYKKFYIQITDKIFAPDIN